MDYQHGANTEGTTWRFERRVSGCPLATAGSVCAEVGEAVRRYGREGKRRQTACRQPDFIFPPVQQMHGVPMAMQRGQAWPLTTLVQRASCWCTLPLPQCSLLSAPPRDCPLPSETFLACVCTQSEGLCGWFLGQMLLAIWAINKPTKL